MAMIKFDHVDKYYGKFHALKYQSRIRERRSCRCHWSFWFRKEHDASLYQWIRDDFFR